MNLFIKSVLIVIVIFLSLLLILEVGDKNNNLLSGFVNNAEDTDPEEDQDEDKIFIIKGYKAIKLDEETISAVGIQFKQLDETSYKPEFIAYAEVIDIAPLVAQKTEYQVLLSEKKVLQNDLNNHNKILKRAMALHEVKSLSARELEKARADRDLKASELNALNTRQTSFEYKLKSNWGTALATLIIDPAQQSELDRIASHESSLILMSLTKDQTLHDINQRVFVNNVNQRDSAIAVSYFDRATQVRNSLYGESFYYLLDSDRFRAGMKLFAWVEEEGEPVNGQYIPDDAVIWYANEPWIFTRHSEDTFMRIPLGHTRKINGGWLLEDKTLVGNKLVVISGGQTLLSEEFKWAIPDENDD